MDVALDCTALLCVKGRDRLHNEMALNEMLLLRFLAGTRL